ncbi:major facilitator superfamily domain-containing protein [Tricharina praecox]|uniref:major facilitator superfamily domain-containing protein n=1 Tax=Tricharina praecox TaxID=43433 RepID=UPI00221E8C0D|nr:major facilitator superfamily domain-containing protein [Tricharina praecox]KAI5856869.1 major facilitator superfamily domain-containing protein [Tricharina praecox]
MPAAAATTRHILRQHDTHLLPFLALLFLLNSLDRSNIGNAETGGFTRYAGLSPSDLNDAVTAFFIAFVSLQPLGAALGKRVGVGRWVGSVMIGWGVLTLLTAFVSTRAQLITLRVCIGALEAGFYPATVFYLGLFYTRFEFAQRLGLFYGQYAVAGAFGGLLSYVVFSIFPTEEGGDGGAGGEGEGRGWHSYQVLFVLEGVFTALVAVITLLWLPTGPGTAWWLSPEERAIAQKRVLADRVLGRSPTALHHRSISRPSSAAAATSHPLLAKPSRRSSTTDAGAAGSEPSLSRTDVFAAFTDAKIWALLCLNILSALPATAFSIFLPLILQGLGHTPLASNALSIPPFLLGATTLWIVTYFSDLTHQRIPFILFGLSLNLLGLLLALLLPPAYLTARYLALCILLAGSFIASPLTVAWISGNIRAPGKRAIALGINGWGNLAGVVAGQLFAPQYAPQYTRPLAVTAACVTVSILGYMAFWGMLVRENRRRAGAEGRRRGGKRGERGERDERAGWLRSRLWTWTGGKGAFTLAGEERSDAVYGC